MAWDKATLKPLTPRKQVDSRFAELLSKVASGQMDKEEAWKLWQQIKSNNCPACDGYGGIAFVGSTGPGVTCGRCGGTGKVSD